MSFSARCPKINTTGAEKLASLSKHISATAFTEEEKKNELGAIALKAQIAADEMTYESEDESRTGFSRSFSHF